MAIDPDRIHDPVRKLRKFLKKSPNRPSSGHIHSLRTNARRFETAVDALGLSSRKNERSLLRKLARIRKRAGKIRDMDVLIGYTLAANLNREQDCIVQLLETLGADRAKHAKKLRALTAKIGPRIRRRLKRTGSKLERVLGQPEKSDSASDPSTEAMAKALRLSEELKNPPRLDKQNLHGYRLIVKELRYILQLSKQADQQEFVNKLGEVKDAIGEWHDWEVLITIAADVLDHGPKCKLLPELRSISEKKYENALALANQMRHTFLYLKSSRRSGSRTHKKPVTRALVLSAASSISA